MNKQYILDNKATFEYLFNLQNSGRVNMFGAANYIQAERGLDINKSKELLAFWMTHYEEIAAELGIEV